MRTIETVVIGAGQAGLATSRALGEAGHDHVVLERGEVGDSWRRRWDSLTLLTPEWMNELPGWAGPGGDPDAFPTAATFADRLGAFAASSQAPVLTATTVLEVSAAVAAGRNRFQVTTDAGAWLARNVVLATGPGSRPVVPGPVRGLAADVDVISAAGYRNPRSLRGGGVLVVGASSSGVQIADELARSGRRVLVAVGRHTRVPRSYRGMDIFWWLQRTGRLDRRIEQMPDPRAARHEASLQVVGRHPAHSVDLPALRQRGVELLGHWTGAEGSRAAFADDLAASCADAERRMRRLLASVDAHAAATGLAHEVLAPDAPAPFLPTASRTCVDLHAEGISTVVLATGYRCHVPWLRIPVLDADGTIRQRNGATCVPGLFTVGQRFQSRRSSGLIAGARHDAAEVVSQIIGIRPQVPAIVVPPEGGSR